MSAQPALEKSISGAIDLDTDNVTGAVSQTAGLAYWSVSEQKWRTLVASAAALGGTEEGPDPAWENGRGRRGDFTARRCAALHPAQRVQHRLVGALEILLGGPLIDRRNAHLAHVFVTVSRQGFMTGIPSGAPAGNRRPRIPTS